MNQFDDRLLVDLLAQLAQQSVAPVSWPDGWNPSKPEFFGLSFRNYMGWT